MSNPSCATPTLSAIAAGAGVTVSTLASKVLVKSQAYQAAAGAIVGKRQLKTAQINSALDTAAVKGVVW
jgi:hypothetical protein